MYEFKDVQAQSLLNSELRWEQHTASHWPFSILENNVL